MAPSFQEGNLPKGFLVWGLVRGSESPGNSGESGESEKSEKSEKPEQNDFGHSCNAEKIENVGSIPSPYIVRRPTRYVWNP